MPKILVIDDEEQICEIVCDLMESEGYEVDSANDGESGLEKLKNDKFDLIFLDILMPGTDELHILQQVQAIQKVPTIIMSGYIPPGMEKKVLDAGAIAVFRKPFNINTMVNTASAVLDT